MKVSYAVWLSLLALAAWQDLQTKEISVRLLFLMGAAGTLIQCFEKSVSLGGWFGGIALGLALLFLGAATRENIGYGDGWLTVVMGMSLGFFPALFSLLFALGFSALAGGGLLMLRRVKRTDRIPFAPFLLAGCVLGLISYGG